MKEDIWIEEISLTTPEELDKSEEFETTVQTPADRGENEALTFDLTI